MSFTGSRIDASAATLEAAAVGAAAESVPTAVVRGATHRDPAARTAIRRAGFRDPPAAPDHTSVVEAIAAAAGWLLDRQHEDGHWRGPLEGDTILESEYILILAWAGRGDRPEIAAAARRILGEQLPGGGWAIHPQGPVDVSASVKAYLALKLAGHDPDSEPLRRARLAIEEAGGPWAVNSFTKFYLALLGQVSYDVCPAVPPEMVLLPDWFPVNLHRVSAWSRTMIVPLSLIWAFKPVRVPPAGRGIAELFDTPRGGGGPLPVGGGGGWDRFFRGIDRVMKACDMLGLRPLRSRAVNECRRWMLERFDGSDGLGAIFPPIVWSIVALRALGCEDDSPEVAECWRQLDRLVERQADGSIRLEPCRSPVWDTAITVRALADASAVPGGRGRGPSGGGGDNALDAGVDWLLDHEIRTPGDWRNAAGGCPPAGWCFQYANRFYPDVDDTAMVLIALAGWRDAAGAADTPRFRRVAGAIGRAVDWLAAMQNSDGGYGAFDRDNDMELLCKVPFADHNAMIDPSSPDLAGRVLEAFGRLGHRSGHPVVDRAIAYLRHCQGADGSWFGRWGVNYIYGTWQAIEGLRAVGVPATDGMIAAAADWIARHQQSCGGWGETPESYADPALAGRGTPTPSQSAWAVAGLVAAGRAEAGETRRGVQWLVNRQRFDGGWEEREFTGTGFPKVFYLRYHYYPFYFPLMALARFARSATAGRLDLDLERVA